MLVLTLDLFLRMQILGIPLHTESDTRAPKGMDEGAGRGRDEPPSTSADKVSTCSSFVASSASSASSSVAEAFFLSTSFLHSLHTCLSSSDQYIRVLAVRLMRHLSTTTQGKDRLLSARMLPPLLHMQKALKEGDVVATELRDAVIRLLL